jgi:hypothetical protein
MLEVALALILIYLLLGVVGAGTIGLIELFTRQRRRYGWYGIMTLFGDDQEFARQLSNHPLIRPLGAGPGRWPLDIPARSFALALLDIVAPSSFVETKSLVYLSEKIAAIPNEYLRRALFSLSSDAPTTSGLLTEISNLYDSTMVRVAAGYRRRIYLRILIAAFLLSLLLNADTINIANNIPRYIDSRAALLSELVPVDLQPTPTPSPRQTESTTFSPTPYPSFGDTNANANPNANANANAGYNANTNTAPSGPPASEVIADLKKSLQEVQTNNLDTLYLPIGWSQNPKDARTFHLSTSGWIFKILGILITTLVASLIGQGSTLVWESIENRSKAKSL